MRTPFLRDLQQRGLVADVTKPDELDAHLDAEPRTLYVGFDPTADSLHIGSLLPLLALRRAQLAGHRPIVLVGGGTGLIGDPAGKAGERSLNPAEQVAGWADRLKQQVQPFLDFDRGSHAAILVDNYTWLSKLELIAFLRDIGKHFSLGAMIARESVKTPHGAPGISYTEFSYQVLQAYDFLELHQRHGCTLQVGGSDQWGNITAGAELIRRMAGAEAYGLTLPLVTKADGGEVREDGNRDGVARSGQDLGVRDVPVLAEQRRCGGRHLSPVLHVPAAGGDRRARPAEGGGAGEAPGAAGAGARGDPDRSRRGRAGRGRGDHGGVLPGQRGGAERAPAG